MYLWTNYLKIFCLNFHNCKIEMVKVPAIQHGCDDSMSTLLPASVLEHDTHSVNKHNCYCYSF